MVGSLTLDWWRSNKCPAVEFHWILEGTTQKRREVTKGDPNTAP